jgi:hypothetical protein
MLRVIDPRSERSGLEGSGAVRILISSFLSSVVNDTSRLEYYIVFLQSPSPILSYKMWTMESD